MLKTWLNPKWRIWFLLALVNFTGLGLMWAWTERETWLWLTPIALSINCLLLTYDQALRFRFLTGRQLVGSDAWGILKSVHELALELQVVPPQVFLIPRSSAQIFTYAKMSKRPRLYLTEGMVELLTPRQLRAVLTFELITIRLHYHVLNYWIAAGLDLGFRLGKVVERAFAFTLGWTPPLAAWLITPALWVVRLFLLNSDDFARLDLATVEALDYPEDLAQALWKMEAYAQTRPWPEPWIFAHMCIVSPLTNPSRFNSRRVQPPLSGRVQSMIGRYPI